MTVLSETGTVHAADIQFSHGRLSGDCPVSGGQPYAKPAEDGVRLERAYVLRWRRENLIAADAGEQALPGNRKTPAETAQQKSFQLL